MVKGGIIYRLFSYIWVMNLMQQAKNDIQRILGATTEFAMALQFIAPNAETLTTTGQFFDRTYMGDIEQQDTSGRHIIVHVSEQPFTDAGYPMRRADGVITFSNHKVIATYADGTTKTFKVLDTQPDYAINMITLQLQLWQ